MNKQVIHSTCKACNEMSVLIGKTDIKGSRDPDRYFQKNPVPDDTGYSLLQFVQNQRQDPVGICDYTVVGMTEDRCF